MLQYIMVTTYHFHVQFYGTLAGKTSSLHSILIHICLFNFTKQQKSILRETTTPFLRELRNRCAQINLHTLHIESNVTMIKYYVVVILTH